MTARSLLTAEEYRSVWAKWIGQVFKMPEAIESECRSLVTLTFATRPWELSGQPGLSRVTRAGRRFEQSLTRALARPSWFGVLERGKLNGRMHLHWLISCQDDVPMYAAMRSHRAKEGFADVVTSRQTSPAEYVSKYVSKSDGDWWSAGGPLFGRVHVASDLGGVGMDRVFRGRIV